jgi:putative selenate reductase
LGPTTCDKCIPVCPNDANFTYVLPKVEIPIVKLRSLGNQGWSRESAGTLRFDKKHQLANFADFCNDCGNCDVFCPEDGGPYLAKPRFFGTHAQWAAATTLDGFFVTRGGEAIDGRFGGHEFRLRVDGSRAAFGGEGFEVTFSESDPESTVSGTAEAEVDLTYFHILNWLRKAVSGNAVNYVNA